MKILHIIPTLAKGGAERLVLDICNELQTKKNQRVSLVTFSSINDYQSLSENIDYQVVPSRFTPSVLSKSTTDLVCLQRFINDFQADIIHSHLWESEILLTQVNVGKAIRFSHFHDNMVQLKKLKLPNNKKDVTDYYEKNIVVKSYKSTNHFFICISKDTLNYARNVLNKKLHAKIFTLNNAINFSNFNLKKDALSETISLINIGSFVPKKNQKMAIDIVNVLKKEHLKVKLTFLGDGPLRKELEQYAQELNLSENIIFKGNVNNVEHYLKSSTIFLHTAIYEPFGLVILEAMAAGLPVVSLDGKGNRDIIKNGENGYILRDQDPLEFANKIQMLFNNKEKYFEISKNGIESAKKYDIKNYGEKLISLYSESISSTKQV